jgi:hypothetical protein
MVRTFHYVKWPHEIATLVREGHTFPENRNQTASDELGLFDAFRRFDRNHGVYMERHDARERVIKKGQVLEEALLDDLPRAQHELHEWYGECRDQRYGNTKRLWTGVQRQFLESVSSRMAAYLLRIAPWRSTPGSTYEAHFSIKDLCARISFGRGGYEGLLQEAIDVAAQKLRKQMFKVRFHAEHRYQETTEHRCTGSCAMQCYETSDVFDLPLQHKSSRTLVRLTDPASYLYMPTPISHVRSDFTISISFKAA